MIKIKVYDIKSNCPIFDLWSMPSNRRILSSYILWYFDHLTFLEGSSWWRLYQLIFESLPNEAVEIRQLVPSLAWSTDWDCDDFSFIRGGIVLAIKTLRDFLPDRLWCLKWIMLSAWVRPKSLISCFETKLSDHSIISQINSNIFYSCRK